MTNIIDENGITIDSLDSLISKYQDALKIIYGTDIVLDPESPDGLLVNFLAQVTRDISEFAVQLYNAESINSAIGSLLDQKVAWFGLTRKPASYTYVNVNIATINDVNLVGMDSNTNPPPNIYTVQDNSGNNYYLANSVSLSANTTTACSFRAENSGAVLVGAGTITTPVSYNQYISSIYNPTSQYIIGIEEESDTELKWRLKSSYYLPSQGFCESVKSTILSYDDIKDCFVIDNPTNTVDVYGIDPYSVWVIVDCPDNTQTGDEIGEVLAIQNTVGTPTYSLKSTYTTVDVDLTTSTNTVSLIGLDGSIVIPAGCYGVEDSSGKKYYLETSTTLPANDTTSCSFRAEHIGEITVAAHDITTPIVADPDITAIDNPTAQTTTGQDSKERSVTRLDSQGLFTTYNYNLVLLERLYVYVDMINTKAGFVFDLDDIKTAIIEGLGDFKIYGICNTNDIIRICNNYDDGMIVGECKVSLTLGGSPSVPTSYSSSTYVQPTNVNKKFYLDKSDIYLSYQ